jgi:hypothetical protein
MHQNNLIPSSGVAITPSDTAFVNLCGIRVADAGTVTVVTAKGATLLMEGFVGPETVAMGIIQVKATGTTCTKITGYTA